MHPDIGDRGTPYVKQWVSVYLLAAHMRIQSLLEGYELSLEDVYSMQMMCAYEVCTTFPHIHLLILAPDCLPRILEFL